MGVIARPLSAGGDSISRSVARPRPLNLAVGRPGPDPLRIVCLDLGVVHVSVNLRSAGLSCVCTIRTVIVAYMLGFLVTRVHAYRRSEYQSV